VHEDLTGFLELELTKYPSSLPDLREVLQKRYNMQVSIQDLSSAAEDLVRMRKAMRTGDLYLKPDNMASGEEP
jgi:hypothetical protein